MTVYIKKINTLPILILVFALVGCSVAPVLEEPVQATAHLTATQTEIPDTPTPTTPPPTATPRPTWTMTPVLESSHSNWKDLQPGEYVAYEIREESEMEAIGVLSLSTMETSILSFLPGIPLTQDGHFLRLRINNEKNLNIDDSDNIMRIFDLWESELITIPIPDDCASGCAWSTTDSELDYILGSCMEEGGFPYLIRMINVEELTCSTISQNYEFHNGFNYPFFSPDGNWVAFYELQSMFPEEQVDDGLYIMPADCLKDHDTCQELMNGPYKIQNTFGSFPFWSKDSRYLAAVTYEDRTVLIFDLTKREITKTLEFDTSVDRLQMVGWLSNGDLVASVRNQENRNTFDLIRYSIDTDQTEIIATGMEGSLYFTFTKE
jgi:WD40-like Beta Propeller Repeat